MLLTECFFRNNQVLFEAFVWLSGKSGELFFYAAWSKNHINSRQIVIFDYFKTEFEFRHKRAAAVQGNNTGVHCSQIQ